MAKHNELVQEIHNMQTIIEKKDAEVRMLQRNADELAEQRQNLNRTVQEHTASIHLLEV
jgi:uncharacterized coiled-coil DUF342 family protein